MLINERLLIPDKARAILWDMDGVLLDTLGLDLVLCKQLLNQYAKTHRADTEIDLPMNFIRSIFACHPPEFWRFIFEFVESEYKIVLPQNLQNKILNEYNSIRNDSVFKVNQGIIEILTACQKKGIKLAVVSNNPTADVRKILTQSAIADYFDIIVGNDLENLKKKPAPDTYIYAARLLELKPENCVVIEDSVLGAEAGYHAGCFTIAVATGGHSFESLEESQWPKQVYSAFKPNEISMQLGNITNKQIETPNDFISHMIEHIAWRMGCGIDLHWNNNDWSELGRTVGKAIKAFPAQQQAGAALGMIDDGSAEVSVLLSEKPATIIESAASIDMNWFLSLRCEQSRSGEPLVNLINGLAQGLGARIHIGICSVEDPHHTWEGVFRSIGIVLGQIFYPALPDGVPDNASEKLSIPQGIRIENISDASATVVRKTAESALRISVDFKEQKAGKYKFSVSPTIRVDGFKHLLDLLAQEAGFSLKVNFDAILLNSSHVVMEDIGLVLGRALKEILIIRMNKHGVQGAGSSINSAQDIETQDISVGISVEGRKFLKFVPFCQSYDEFKKSFLLTQSLVHGLFPEDLDDFIDGLAGGLVASIMIHIKKDIEPSIGWEMIFSNLGKALKTVFQTNPHRKGVPPGVKATLS
ncbi:MAG: HAD-IA family hydrolase [Desulfobacula sp.]|nr:HAD-IA family hydrolase [Desulfobacula sp.]